MSNRSDPLLHSYEFACPACGQNYFLSGLMARDGQELACSTCNAVFRIRFDGERADTVLTSPATNAPLGPAEGPQRR